MIINKLIAPWTVTVASIGYVFSDLKPAVAVDATFLLPYASGTLDMNCLEEAAKTIKGIPTTYSDCSRDVVANYLRDQ